MTELCVYRTALRDEYFFDTFTEATTFARTINARLWHVAQSHPATPKAHVYGKRVVVIKTRG